MVLSTHIRCVKTSVTQAPGNLTASTGFCGHLHTCIHSDIQIINFCNTKIFQEIKLNFINESTANSLWGFPHRKDVINYIILQYDQI